MSEGNKEESKSIEDILYEMQLHEIRKVNKTFKVMAVMNGWIYYSNPATNKDIPMAVFVPCN